MAGKRGVKLESVERAGSHEVHKSEYTQLAYAVHAATERRNILAWAEEMAVQLLNQVGVLVGEQLEDLADLVRVSDLHNLTEEKIMAAYRISEGYQDSPPEFWDGDWGRLLTIAREHLREVAWRRSIDVDETVMELNHDVPVTQYRGADCIILAKIFGHGTENDEAWPTAFMTPLEAYAKMLRLNYGWWPIEAIRTYVHWCRRAVGLPEDLGLGEEERGSRLTGLLG